MKTVSAGMTTHLNLECTTLATLWKVKRLDGTIFGFTSHDQDIAFNMSDGDGTVTYFASTGMTPSAVEGGSDLSTDNLEITAFLDSSAITEADIRAGLYDFATINVALVNFKDLTIGQLKLRKGTLGQIKMVNGQFMAEVRGLSFYFGTALGTTFGPVCRADLGDAACTIDIEALAEAGTVSTVTDKRTFNPVGGLTATVGYFDGGILTWLTGDNAGLVMEVDTWDGTTILLFESMPNTIVAGDTFNVEPGCNKTIDDCQTKFSNIINFQGEPFIPGMDAILEYPQTHVG